MGQDEPRGTGAPWGRIAIVAVAALCVYTGSVRNGFTFDDRWIVERNPAIRGLDHIPRIWRSADWGEEKVTRHYRPLTLTTYALNYALHGLRPAGYHLVNILLHAAVSVLVLILALRIGVPPPGALIAALAFAVHPIHTEAVAGVVGRAELLAVLAFIAAFLFWLRFRERGRPGDLVALALLYGLGVFCKEQSAVLPAVLVAAEGVSRRFGDPIGRRRIVQACLACGAILVVDRLLGRAVTGSFGGYRTPPGGYPGLLFGEPFGVRGMTSLKVLDRAVRLLVFPIALSPDYSFDQISIPRSFQPSVAAGGVIALAIVWASVQARSTPRRFVMCAWTVLAWVPVSNLLVPITTLFGERLLYLPSVALAVIAGDWIASGPLWRDGRSRRITQVLLVVMMVFWSVRTVDRNLDWRTQKSLFAEAARTSPRSARVRMNNGLELLTEGKTNEAIRELETATEILPSYANAYSNLSLAYERAGRPGDAERAIRGAILAQSDRASYWVQLGRILIRERKDAEAAGAFGRALALEPGNLDAQAELEALRAAGVR